MKADPTTCRVRNLTPEYPAYYENPSLEAVMDPGSVEWEYLQVTKMFGHLAVATACSPKEMVFVFYTDGEEIFDLLQRRITPENPEGRGWYFSDPEDPRYGHPDGIRYFIDLRPTRWLQTTKAGLEDGMKRGGFSG